MKWITCIAFLSVILLPLIACIDDVEGEPDIIKNNVVEEEKILQSSVFDHETGDKKESLSHDYVNSPDLPSDDGSIKINDITEQSGLYNQIKEMENNNNNDGLESDKNILSDEPACKSDGDSHDNVCLNKEDVINPDNIGTLNDNVIEVVNSQDESESSPVSDNNNNGNSISEQKEETSNLITKNEDNNNVHEEEKDMGASATKKQRYFPLLYTFGSMFSSFLAEFGEVSGSSDSASANSSDSNVKNSTYGDGLELNSNSTSNSTEPGKKTRFQCALVVKNSTTETNETAMVKIINSTELLEMLNFSKNQKSAASPCVLVMFYTKWCHFSARTAPEYNALARAFPQLDVLAVDTSHFSYLNAKFGTVAVPNIMLFHSRSAVRFNHTTRDLEHFIQFVGNNTGLESALSVAVLPEDYEGPLSSKVVQGRDWLLWLAWAFILVYSIYGFFFSLYGQAVITRLRVLWAEHQHIE